MVTSEAVPRVKIELGNSSTHSPFDGMLLRP